MVVAPRRPPTRWPRMANETARLFASLQRIPPNLPVGPVPLQGASLRGRQGQSLIDLGQTNPPSILSRWMHASHKPASLCLSQRHDTILPMRTQGATGGRGDATQVGRSLANQHMQAPDPYKLVGEGCTCPPSFGTRGQLVSLPFNTIRTRL